MLFFKNTSFTHHRKTQHNTNTNLQLLYLEETQTLVESLDSNKPQNLNQLKSPTKLLVMTLMHREDSTSMHLVTTPMDVLLLVLISTHSARLMVVQRIKKDMLVTWVTFLLILKVLLREQNKIC